MTKKEKKDAGELGEKGTFKVTSVKQPRWELDYLEKTCGCRVIADSQDIQYCPTHKAGPELLKMLAHIKREISISHYHGKLASCLPCDMDAAIAKAEGKEIAQ